MDSRLIFQKDLISCRKIPMKLSIDTSAFAKKKIFFNKFFRLFVCLFVFLKAENFLPAAKRCIFGRKLKFFLGNRRNPL